MTSARCVTRSPTISSRRERRVPAHRLPALAAGHGPLDGSRPPGQERRLDRQGHQDLRGPGRALDRQRRRRPGADPPRTRRPADRRQAAGPDDGQLLGGHRVRSGRSRDRPASSSSAPCGPICMAFTALDALREGYEVYPVVDAIGGTSPEAHRAGLDRVIQAGGQPVSWVSRGRVAARLGPPGHGRGARRDRPHRPPTEGAIARPRPLRRACTARQPASNPARAERERRFVHINVRLNRRTQHHDDDRHTRRGKERVP